MLSVLSSTATAEAVSHFVAEAFPVGEIAACRLLNRGYNDSYAVTAEDGRRYVARFGGRRLRGRDNVGYETAFLAHLATLGVPVAAPVATGDGGLWTTATLPEGPRSVVLFHWAEGESPRAARSDHAHAQGVTLARIHRTSASFVGSESRLRLDADQLLWRPLAAVRTHPSLAAEQARALGAMADRLAARLGDAADALSEVYCHGDCHGANARIGTDDRGQPVATFFDFDDGGPGWLAYDLAVYL